MHRRPSAAFVFALSIVPLELHNLAEKSPEVRDHAVRHSGLVKRLRTLHEEFE